MRGYDVWRHPALDQADGVEGRAEIGIDRKRQATQLDERVDELLDRRLALLRDRRMRRPPGRGQPHAQDPARRRRQPAVGRLAIDQEPAAIGNRIRRHRTVTAPLLADDKQQPDPPLAGSPQPLGGRDLRREDPLGIASAPPNQPAIFYPARKEWRHTIEVGGEHHLRIVNRGEDVGATALDRLLGDVVPERAQPPGKPAARLFLAAGGRIDVDERSSERQRV